MQFAEYRFFLHHADSIFVVSKENKQQNSFMKKIIMALAFIAFTVGNVAFAGEKEIDKKVKQAFDQEFVGAADIQWYRYDEYTKVDFTFNTMHLVAYFNNDGEKLAVVRNIHFSALPLDLQLGFRRNYKGYWITQICEVATKDGTQYRLTLENAERTIKLQSDESIGWEVMAKESK